MRTRSWIFAVATGTGLIAQPGFTPGLKPFIAVDAPVIALEHVRILDGTGAPPRENQTVVIEGGRIQAVGPADQIQVPEGVTMGLRPTKGDEDAGKSKSPVAYARGSERKECYRAATVRESVPWQSIVD